MEKKTSRRNWALLCAGGAAAVALLWGCFNPVSVPTPDGKFGTDPGSENLGSSNLDSLSPAAQGPEDQETGIAGEEFIITLGIGDAQAGGPPVEGPLVGGPPVPNSRSVVGPGAEGIQYGGIRNIVQVIVVDAGTGDVAHFQQEVRGGNAETSAALTVKNLWPGKRYHILVLTGHRERDYAAEPGPENTYVWKTDGSGTLLPPTLLAVGLLADREIKSREKTLSIPMKPLAVDTVFTYGGVTAQAALPVTGGGAKLPAGVEASIVWTLSGGIEDLRNAQAGLPEGINLNWGGQLFKPPKTILRLNGSGPMEAPTALNNNQITLDLGVEEQNAGTSGSANFKLEYLPFGFEDMTAFTPFNLAAASWIIRNGVNDQAQNTNTTFALEDEKIPWNGTKNGNGAVVFTAEPLSITLTDPVSRPVTGGTPTTSFSGGTYYSGTVSWTKTDGGEPHSGLFQAGTAYTAAVTLSPAAGYVFPASVQVTHDGAIQPIGAFAYKAGTESGTVSGTITFDKTQGVPITGAIDLTALVPAPEKGKTPKTVIDAPQYMGAVAWKEDGEVMVNEVFQAGKAYTATVTLTAKPGYTFAQDTLVVYAKETISDENPAGESITVIISGLDVPATSNPW
jgi:hypothetical protein